MISMMELRWQKIVQVLNKRFFCTSLLVFVMLVLIMIASSCFGGELQKSLLKQKSQAWKPNAATYNIPSTAEKVISEIDSSDMLNYLSARGLYNSLDAKVKEIQAETYRLTHETNKY